jgi:hypothetical protein
MTKDEAIAKVVTEVANLCRSAARSAPMSYGMGELRKALADFAKAIADDRENYRPATDDTAGTDDRLNVRR